MEGRHSPPREHISYPAKPDIWSMSGRQFNSLVKSFVFLIGASIVFYKGLMYLSDKDPGPLRKLLGRDTKHLREVVERQDSIRENGLERFSLLSPHIKIWIHEDKVRIHQASSKFE